MAKFVDEIRNPELLTLRPEDHTEDALRHLVTLGITGAPVVDPYGRVVGMIAMRDLLRKAGGTHVSDQMSSPALSVRGDATIADAARAMTDSGHHRLAVIDATGKCTGVVSVIDVLRGLLGAPVGHPPTFPHADPETGTAWTDPCALSLDGIARAPEGPGVIVLVSGGAGVRETAVWAESVRSIAARLHELLSQSPEPRTELGAILADRSIRFLATVEPNESARERLFQICEERVRSQRWPERETTRRVADVS